jgi:hypothetical protein
MYVIQILLRDYISHHTVLIDHPLESGPLCANALKDGEQGQDDTSTCVTAPCIGSASTEQKRRENTGNTLIGDIYQTSIRPLVIQKT